MNLDSSITDFKSSIGILYPFLGDFREVVTARLSFLIHDKFIGSDTEP